MRIPPYYQQERPGTCSLAVLRMSLAHFGIQVSEKELEDKVIADYGTGFKSLWNPTVAKLACQYGLETVFSAKWPLLKPSLMQKAVDEYHQNPANFNLSKYEDPDDSDSLPMPLPLSYKEMFLAVKYGCKTNYGKLTKEKLKEEMSSGALIQTSIKLNRLYPNGKQTFHSILLFGLDGDTVHYHDPHRGASLTCSIDHLLKATARVGAFLVYRQKLYTQ